MSGIRVSVVTVTYNCEDAVEVTIKSVINQSYKNIQYVIIDGDSKDKTMDIVREYSCHIDTIISEPDQGIFDAMNKGLNYVDGEFVIFINAGDYFIDEDVLYNTFEHEHYEEDIVYGDVFVQTELGLKLVRARAIYEQSGFSKRDLVFKSQGFCHQALFTRTSVLKRIKFDLAYPLGADYDTTYKVYKRGNHRLKYLGYPVSVFSDIRPGASHTHRFDRSIYDERCAMFDYKRDLLYNTFIFLMMVVTNVKYYAFEHFPLLTNALRKNNYI